MEASMRACVSMLVSLSAAHTSCDSQTSAVPILGFISIYFLTCRDAFSLDKDEVS